VVRYLMGGASAAVMLLVLAFTPPTGPPRHLPELTPQRPTVQQRFATAMFGLGETVHAVTYRQGVVTAVVHDVAAADLPALHVDAAIAATTVLHSCRCPLRAYAIASDRFGPDLITVTGGSVDRVQEQFTQVEDVTLDLDGVALRCLRPRIRESIAGLRGGGRRRITLRAVRGGRAIFAWAKRPSTGTTEAWADPSLHWAQPAEAATPVRPVSGC
jgi:hypothetical protein